MSQNGDIMENISLTDTIKMDFAELDRIRSQLNDNYYAEYLFHKLFDNPDAQWDESRRDQAGWQYPECWLARYYLYYMLHRDYLQDATVLDLGSNLNFYSVWAILNGARHVDAVEPDVVRFNLGKELIDIRHMSHQVTCIQDSIDGFFDSYQGQSYDVVFLLDVFYYLTNGLEVLKFIKEKIRPRYLVIESTVIDDYREQGHFELWYSSTDTKVIQSFKSISDQEDARFSLRPSRNALNNIIHNLGWKISSYYTYQDFIGHGESPPRKTGHKNFYMLES